MDRLTGRNIDGIAYTKIPLNPSRIEIGACYTGFVADRLSEYEDIGTPAELRELKAENERLRTALALSGEPIENYETYTSSKFLGNMVTKKEASHDG